MRRTTLSLAFLAAPWALACTTTTTEPKRGELVLVLQTDLSVPKDVSSLRVEVLTSGRVQFAQTYLIGPAPELQLPGALSIVAGDNPADPVSIRILARQVPDGADGDQGVPRVLREIITTVPPDRTAMLPVTLHWLCADEKSLDVSSSGEVSSACGEGQTCVAGSCVAKEVDSATLPDFDSAVVEGTSETSGCFDVLPCLAGAPLAPVDPATCRVAAPAGDASLWNVALRLPPGSNGTCDAANCYVPLDFSDEGWSQGPSGTLQLPAAVCETTPPREVVVASGCSSKTALTPICGPASRFETAVGGGSQMMTPVDPNMMMPPVGGGPVPETTMLTGVQDPRHVVVEPLGVFFLGRATDGTDGVFWCALAGCDSMAQSQWLGPPGGLAAGFAHNQSHLVAWGVQQQSMQLHACPFPGGCAGGSSVVIANGSATNPPMPMATPGLLAMTDSAVLFREADPGLSIRSCSMFDTGCGAAAPALVTDSAPVIALSVSGARMAWSNAAGELQFCEHAACEASKTSAIGGQMFVAGPILLDDTALWASDRAVRACELSDCAGSVRDLFNSAAPVSGLASDGTDAFLGFLRVPQPPVHDIVKVSLSGDSFGSTLRSGDGIVSGLGVQGEFVYSFVVDPSTGKGDLFKTSKSAMVGPPMP
ncbi:MAG TPA: hypothetical protein VHP33_17075 [Polyangiaceae bacterium]|nr:hypothetical protein [Polyangiaceae bacterium]